MTCHDLLILCLQTGTPVVLPASVSLLMKESRLGSHFSFAPSTGQSSHYSLTSYADFNPFQISVPSGCSDNKEASCASSSKSCC